MENLAIIEIKKCSNNYDQYMKDIYKLIKFTEKYKYKSGIFLTFSSNIDASFLADSDNEDLVSIRKIFRSVCIPKVLWLHHKYGADLQDVIACNSSR